jgi:tRNA threonylcarbamoyladenosine biosynthesis protein TsaB
MNSSEFKCLAVETASEEMSVAACRGEQRSERREAPTGGRARPIFKLIQAVLGDLQLDLAELHCVAFGCGPGSFTGLRVGAAAAQSIAFGANLPVCRISSLAALARGAMRLHGCSQAFACKDARRSQAYAAVNQTELEGRIRVVLPEQLVCPDTFRLETPEPFFAAGPGWSAYPELAARHRDLLMGADCELLPRAADLLPLAADRYQLGELVSPEHALPNYLRDRVTS